MALTYDVREIFLMSWLFVVLLLMSFSSAQSSDILISPTSSRHTFGVDVAIIIVQGAQVRTSQYLDLAIELRNTLEASNKSLSVWVGIPQSPLNVPNSLTLGEDIDRVMTVMRASGMNESKFIVIGHSLGGKMLVDFVREFSSRAQTNKNKLLLPHAIVLIGAFDGRKNYGKGILPVPSLTIGGSIDGLCRVTRIMEAYLKQKHFRHTHPVIVVEGMNHFSIASGNPPMLVKIRDLKSEISHTSAINTVSKLVDSFIISLQKNYTPKILAAALIETIQFVEPLVKAYRLENPFAWQTQCIDESLSSSSSSSFCSAGSPWVEIAARHIGGALNNVSFVVHDRFHDIDILHKQCYTKLKSNCTSDSTSTHTCVVEEETVSQHIYEALDTFDTGFSMTSAIETRAKMNSRQRVQQAAGFSAINFTASDGGSLCADINRKAYDVAMHLSTRKSLTRFKQYGQPMVFGEDMIEQSGPQWILKQLEYKSMVDAYGKTVLQIRAPTLKTPNNFVINQLSGAHYCKLLMPSRAIEWIYVDGLRLRYGIERDVVAAQTALSETFFPSNIPLAIM